MRVQILFVFSICAICTFVSSAKNGADNVATKADIAQIMRAIEDINKKTDKILKVVDLLYEPNGEQKCNTSAIKNDIVNEIIVQFKSICESKVDNRTTSNSFNKDLNSTKQFCDPNPCLNGGQCEVTSNGSDYRCTQCPHPISGKNCEELTCGGNKCFQLNDTLYAVYERKGTWDEANITCVDEGMTLAMLKNEESDVFVRNQLKTLYKLDEKTVFWFGLKGDSDGGQWIDGTSLGDYTGGQEFFKLSFNDGCGSLLSKDGMVSWYPDRCIQFAGFNQYPLCEKRL